ncbi:efflux RND transporter periplasmic adaptor subunit [Pusillimonas sp. ANT_WB101]|uniref:efflux RND transporter periplasmic adaptor subunit n=1 Tax=Pusillimonas sp. ANT_WB101 TaxID=2597356 RepID=UPI0011EDEB2E|nr:efflux RND transporter periplasmic adaptor subunit [Pusillimonas sp. ANT_WB101]KAA0911516.1 efflux RND transporter periplasmic adaptor subunit [Pusillimonas sp. ANT_WB101]
MGQKRKWLVSAVVLLMGMGFFAYRAWQGPVVSAYQLVNRPLVQYVVATGRITSESRVQVGSEITGVVTERLVREGDHVVAGEVLIRLRADELLAKQQEAIAALAQLRDARRPRALADLKQAEAQLAQARREVKRRQVLLASNAMPREEKERADQALAIALAAAEQARVEVASLGAGESEDALIQARVDAAQAALSKTVLQAQFPGVILTRNVEPGDLVQPGRVLLEIARDDDVELLVPVDERNLGLLRLGQMAVCIADAYPLQEFHAVVHRIAPSVDAQRGTVDVHLSMEEIPDYLRDDLTVTATIETGRRQQALALPNDALFNKQGSQASVWRVRQGVAQQVQVSLGLQGGAMTEITSGLQDGDWVSTSVDLAEGQRVRLSAQKQGAAMSEAETSKELPIKF